jgi:molybdate transport system substrate-binding protein
MPDSRGDSMGGAGSWFSAALFCLFCLFSVSANAETQKPAITVFAAASLKPALDPISQSWTATSGHSVSISYASSAALAKQIAEGAPADIFISADAEWMDWASARNLIVPESRRIVTGNTLVLIASKGSKVTIKIEAGFGLAGQLGDGRLATGDPASVPLGKYAKAALTSLGVWDAVAPKIAGAENARVALQLVARGEAPLGIVYGSDAASEPNVERLGSFPETSHAPISYPGAVVATSANPDSAAFLTFLTGREAQERFIGSGFVALPHPPS